MNIGQYKVIRQIGQGSFGRTFYAEHQALDESACLKEDMTGDPIIQAMFRAEAKLLWGVHHASLPTVKDYFEQVGYNPILAMSFIKGANIGEVVAKNGAIDDEHVAWILQRLLDALSYLHYKGVVHCDVKPENIILNTKEHNAVLVDFGLYVQNPGKGSQAKGGTEFFIPPEFAQGLPPIPASDIYSLGKTALFMAGGNPQTGSFPTNMNKEFQRILGSMIRQDPMARPQDARELNQLIGQHRRDVYKRTSTREEIKFRQ
ncbi:serine/threonine protein kinase [Patescibacteria group bacterium]|nr:serine/threonine protein kinase [Patescibacteria group bacterium]